MDDLVVVDAWYILMNEALAMAREKHYDDPEYYGRIIGFLTSTSEVVE